MATNGYGADARAFSVKGKSENWIVETNLIDYQMARFVHNKGPHRDHCVVFLEPKSKWVQANCQGNLTKKMLGFAMYLRLTSIPDVGK